MIVSSYLATSSPFENNTRTKEIPLRTKENWPPPAPHAPHSRRNFSTSPAERRRGVGGCWHYVNGTYIFTNNMYEIWRWYEMSYWSEFPFAWNRVNNLFSLTSIWYEALKKYAVSCWYELILGSCKQAFRNTNILNDMNNIHKKIPYRWQE